MNSKKPRKKRRNACPRKSANGKPGLPFGIRCVLLYACESSKTIRYARKSKAGIYKKRYVYWRYIYTNPPQHCSQCRYAYLHTYIPTYIHTYRQSYCFVTGLCLPRQVYSYHGKFIPAPVGFYGCDSSTSFIIRLPPCFGGFACIDACSCTFYSFYFQMARHLTW